MQHPLKDIRVLDLSRVVSGPFAARMLSDLGADVVKIEPPTGDGTRNHGRKVRDISGFFNQQNAGKRNICIDLQSSDAAELVKDLVGVADIVIENYRPGVMQRLGIDYATLNEVNPKIIMLSISGYGQSGPESYRPSYAPVVHAELGLMHRMARRNGTPPGDLPLSVADTNASLHGLVAILAALHLKTQTGLGQHIDLSMMDATFATDDRVHFELEDVPDSLPLSPIFDLPFGPVFIATDAKLLFRRLSKRGFLTDPASADTLLDTKIELRQKVITDFLNQCETAQEFAELMHQLDLPWGEIRDPRQLSNQPTLKDRNMIVEVDDRDGGTRPVVQTPFRFSNAESGVRGPSAHRGEHNRAVLKDWLDLQDPQIDTLTDNAVLQADEFSQEPSR